MKNSNLKEMDLITSVAWMIFGILIIIGSLKLKIGNLIKPGPGFMPFLLGLILFFVALAIFMDSLKEIRRGINEEVKIWAGVSLWRVGLIIVALLGFGFAFEKVGFSVATFFCLFFIYKVVGSEKLSKVFFLTILTVTSAYVLFIIILKVQLPSFPLEIFF